MRGMFARQRFVLLIGLVSAAMVVVGLPAQTPAAAPSPYVVVDLGTLGGTYSEARYMNDAGQIAGYSKIASGDIHAFFWTRSGGMVDLGTLGGASSSPSAMNDQGQVVGTSETASDAFHAFSWTKAGGMIDLGTLGGHWNGIPGQIVTSAQGVNNAGQVVGTSITASGLYHAYLWTQADGMVDLGAPAGSTYSTGVGINASGQVVGECGVGGVIHACSWTRGSGWNDLGSLDRDTHVWSYEQTGPVINASGQAIGYGVVNASHDIHAFSWTQTDGLVDLGTMGGNRSWTNAVNDAGQVVGGSVDSSGAAHPFLWSRASGTVDLCPTAAGSYSDAYALNDAGQVVGTCYRPDGSYRLFSWTQGGGSIDLPGLGRGGGSANAVNEAGLIAGASITTANEVHAALWSFEDVTAPTATPVQSPAANGAGWNGTDVTVTWNWADEPGGSGIDPQHCTASSTSTAEGTSALTATCRDRAGNTGSASLTLKVDKTPPVLSPADVVTDATSSAGAVVDYAVAAADNLDPAPTVGCWPPSGSVFAIGVTPVSCSAKDAAGNKAPGSFMVHVRGLASRVFKVDLGPGGAAGINDDGIVVGSNNGRATMWKADGTAVDLGTLGSATGAASANDAGEIMGSGTTNASPLIQVEHPFYWSPATGMIDIGTLRGGTSVARGWAMNDRGEIVGATWNRDGTGYSAFAWTSAGGMTELPSLGHTLSVAEAVNNAGQIAGIDVSSAWGSQLAVLWTPGHTITTIGTLGGTGSQVTGMNDRGQVVGYSLTQDVVWHAFIWTPGRGMLDLTPDAPSDTFAWDVNEAGDVAGESGGHAFFWSPEGGLIDLGTLAGGTSRALRVNDAREVVGESDGRAFLWTEATGMVDLGTRMVNPSRANSTASAISELGAIAGSSGGHAMVWNVYAPEKLASLKPTVAAAGLGAWLTGDLIAHLDSALQKLDRPERACNELKPFLVGVFGELGKSHTALDAATADQLVEAATVEQALGCLPAGSPLPAAEHHTVDLAAAIDGMDLRPSFAGSLGTLTGDLGADLARADLTNAKPDLNRLRNKIDAGAASGKLTSAQASELAAIVAQVRGELGL